jgi:predicted permease
VQVVAHKKMFAAGAFSYPVYRELRRQTGVFASVIAYQQVMHLVDFGGGPVRAEFALISGSYFGFFAAQPALGRLIDEKDDEVEGGSPVCVLSYDAWQERFGGDPGVLNRTIRVDGLPLRIIGVAPRGFIGADLERRQEVWAPTTVASDLLYLKRDSTRPSWLRIMGRLKPNVSLAEGNARLEAASPAIEAAASVQNMSPGGFYRLLDGSHGNDSWRSSLHDPLSILMGAVSLVLLVACANLANLLLARAGERRQEFAIKLALGIDARRLLRQLMLETVAIALTGGALAWMVALTVTRYLLDLFNAGVTYRQLRVAPDASVLLYTLAACLLTAVIAGLYPAWQASRTDIARRLPMTAGRGFLRRGLILVQVTLAVVLLFGASLFAHSLRKLKTIDLGYDIERVLSVSIDSSGSRQNFKPALPELTEALERVRRLPGVEAAAWSDLGMLSGSVGEFSTEVSDASGRTRQVEAHMILAGAGFLRTMRMPLFKGRDFGPGDRPGTAPVALVNQKLAALAWPREDPIGKQIHLRDKTEVEVIGVVGDSKYSDPREADQPIFYYSFDQRPGAPGTLQIRCRGDMDAIARDVREIVRTTAPAYQVSNVASLEVLRDGVISQDRLLAFLSSLFGGLGTALALAGIYGLIAYSVTRRTREVGIRMSVGAQRGDVLWLFLRESAVLVAAGMAVGMPLALAMARFAGKMLYGVSTMEPADIALTLTAMAAGGLAAAYLPGRRAARIDPVRALRYD